MNTILTVTSALIWLAIFVVLLGKLVEAVKSHQKLNLNNQWVVARCDSGIGLGVLKQLDCGSARVAGCSNGARGCGAP